MGGCSFSFLFYVLIWLYGDFLAFFVIVHAVSQLAITSLNCYFPSPYCWFSRDSKGKTRKSNFIILKLLSTAFIFGKYLITCTLLQLSSLFFCFFLFRSFPIWQLYFKCDRALLDIFPGGSKQQRESLPRKPPIARTTNSAGRDRGAQNS